MSSGRFDRLSHDTQILYSFLTIYDNRMKINGTEVVSLEDTVDDLLAADETLELPLTLLKLF